MHMFRVDFVTNHVSGMIETGKIIVMAESHDQANDIVVEMMKLPASRTRCESSKIKPAFYKVESRQGYPSKKTGTWSSAYGADTTIFQRYQVMIEVTNVTGGNEQEVLRKIGEELQARGAQTKRRHNLQMLINCFPGQRPSAPATAMEKIEAYGKRGGRVSGGQVRGR